MQGENVKKRQRGANFTSRETTILLEIISKYKNTVENKKTDGISIEDKCKIWKHIAFEFNATTPDFNHRTVDSLKKFYENKKKVVRKQKAEERKQILLTGGGPEPKIFKDKSDDIILSLVDPLTVVGDTNEFDSDATPMIIEKSNVEITYEIQQDNVKEVENDVYLINLDSPIGILEDNDVENENKQNYSTSWENDVVQKPANVMKRPSFPADATSRKKVALEQPSTSRRPTHTVVRSLSSSALAEKYDQLVDKKLVIADYELQKIKIAMEKENEEHRLRCSAIVAEMQQKENESKLKEELLKLDIALKREQLKALLKQNGER